MKVSVISSCWHSNEQFLRECIESIINQSFQDWEFILANDEQPEIDMKSIVESYKDPRIKYHDNVVNMGFSNSYNNLISMTSGEYFAIAGHDDISTPDRLKILVNELDKDPELDFCSGRLHIFGKTRERDDGQAMLPERVSQELMFVQPMKSGTAMFRKSSWVKNNLSFTNLVQVAHDYEMWSRTRHMKHLIVDDILLNYRKHDNNATVLNGNKIRIDHAMIVRRNLSEIKIFAPFGLCQLLDPHGHPEMDSNVKKEYIELFKRYRDKLVPEIGVDLFERKLEEISNK